VARLPTTLVAVVVVLAALTTACRDDGADTAAFCAAAADSQRFGATFDGLDPTDVDAALVAYESARRTEMELRAVAPDAVRADVDVLVGFFEDLIAGLRTADPASVRRPSVYADLRPRYDQVEAASERITLYVETNC
jgi:hypothetical protein